MERQLEAASERFEFVGKQHVLDDFLIRYDMMVQGLQRKYTTWVQTDHTGRGVGMGCGMGGGGGGEGVQQEGRGYGWRRGGEGHKRGGGRASAGGGGGGMYLLTAWCL